ncbi:MAG: YbjN domain-containing protein [Paracoccaceae bacterium]
MSVSEDFLTSGDIHPIDIVETLAENHDWDFDRVTDDQIAMAVEGQWRTYSLTLAWSAHDETLRLISTFEYDPPAEKLAAVHDLINRANDMVWAGAFTWWAEQKMMVWRYGLVLAGGQIATPEQIDRMITQAVTASERFYPAFQMVAWGEDGPEKALGVALAEAYGRA